ncbi:hypothetical protein BD626DRAFT_406310 [Schizophyllum amplum]|uniref:Uncharacterized protein n=1 Tax=Schizophyllum amplum TaxID=97359 RepID=A0A550BWI5_9AGAR|nr:hypothetical protein BD626DRAFT_412830 [Auriculariopsis ampla]TRM61192.1 hypothetical protein BD626DRAFT_406310 [Auriculariopsis ampla]
MPLASRTPGALPFIPHRVPCSPDSASYRPVSTTPKIIEDSASSAAGPVEMVTVPALGPEWGKDEMRNMTKAGKRERRNESRHDKWIAWKRGERGMCGKWFNRKMTAWVSFATIIVIALVLAFTIPRVPSVSFDSNKQYLVNVTDGDLADIDPQFSRLPANFSFAAMANLQLNTQDNYLPLKFSHLYGKVYDSETDEMVAEGDTGAMTLPAKAYPDVQLPLNFTYSASNDSDATWLNFYDSCKNKIASVDGVRPALKFKIVLDMHIIGLPSTYHGSVSTKDAECPFELAQNAA